MKVMSSLFVLLFLVLSVAQAQNHDEIFERMQRDHERIRKMLWGDRIESYDEFNKHFEEILKKFHNGSFEDFFKDENFNQFFERMDPYSHMNSGEAHWMETPKERILILKIETPKDSPLNIKIEKGLINISGEMERIREQKDAEGKVTHKSRSVTSFNQTFSVPRDVNEGSAKIENDKGEIKIRFTKSTGIDSKPSQDSLKPLQPQEGDSVI